MRQRRARRLCCYHVKRQKKLRRSMWLCYRDAVRKHFVSLMSKIEMAQLINIFKLLAYS